MFTDHGAAIRDGLNKIRSTGADVVLIDPQFAPKVIVKAEAEHMVELIATTAKMENVDLFSLCVPKTSSGYDSVLPGKLLSLTKRKWR
jgi:hypothetical protein